MDDEINNLTQAIIGAAFEVSNELGVGFLEKVYENALAIELRKRGMRVEVQKRIQVFYKGDLVGDYIVDLLVDNRIIIELKCCSGLASEHTAQCLNYLRATGFRLALLLNFQKPKIEIKRIAL